MLHRIFLFKNGSKYPRITVRYTLKLFTDDVSDLCGKLKDMFDDNAFQLSGCTVRKWEMTLRKR